MALQNSNDFAPTRIGLGAGTLYGIGVGIYDLSRINKGDQFYLSGTFNDGTNSSILVLLDTFYGAAGGALLASSVSLILKAPLGEAVQYGAGAGAWAGFGFGLVDAFSLAQGPVISTQSISSAQTSSGLISYQSDSKDVEIGMIAPELLIQKHLTGKTFYKTYTPTLNLFQIHIGL